MSEPLQITPASPAAEPRPAKITDRFLAFLLDGVPFLLGYYLSLYLLIARFERLPNTMLVWKKLAIAWVILYLGYQALSNQSGATFGKRIFGLRVIDSSGQAPSLIRSVVRALGYILSTPLMNLGFLWSLMNRRSRTWHDLLSGTFVVEMEEKSPGARLFSAFLSLAVLAAIFGGNLWQIVMGPTPADKEAISRAEEGLAILAGIEESYKARHGVYTESLLELAKASGDVAQFREAMGELFQPDGFILLAERDSYDLRAKAKDRRRTVVRVRGP